MRRPRQDPLSTATTTITISTSPSSSQQPPQAQVPQPPNPTPASPPPPPPTLPRHHPHRESRAPRYHINHFDSGGMPVSLWGMDRRDVWRTCFCFHVRTVTIFIGVWYLMMYILALSFHAALLMYEPGQEGFPGGITRRAEETMLPTPVSKIGIEPKQQPQIIPMESPKAEPLTIDHDHIHRTSRGDAMRNSGPLTLVLDTNRKATSQVILLTVCNMLITLLMVYGAVRGKPSYLMPFFVLRVFDFCIFCLTMVGYFSYLPNVTEGIMNTQGMPFRDEFLRMDPQLLSFITLIFIVAFIAVKAYIIGVIWNCYKYLMLRNTVIRGVIAYRHDDPTSIMGLQQNLLPDLPDYETAVNDPRYAKKPPSDLQNGGNAPNSVLSPGAGVAMGGNAGGGLNGGQVIAMPPPPPYSVAVASEPLHLVIPMSQNNNNTIDIVPQQQSAPEAPADAATNSPVNNNNNSNVQKDATEEIHIQTPPPTHNQEQTSPVFVPVQSQDNASNSTSPVTATPPAEMDSPAQNATTHNIHHQ